MTTYNKIHSAIQNRQQVHAVYRGHLRQLCPHVLGTKNGREQALFYQFGGYSSSGPIIKGSSANWRCLFLDELSDVEVVDGAWHTADNHSQRQTCVDHVHASV